MGAVKLMHRIIAVAGLHSCKLSTTSGCGYSHEIINVTILWEGLPFRAACNLM